MLSFEELTEARRALQSFCLLHVPSLLSLRSGNSFKLFPDDPSLERSRRVRHLTTTATCLSSLLDCPSRFRPTESEDLDSVYSVFARRSLRREWKSEGSAQIYCRCRALPLVIKFSQAFDPMIRKHLLTVLAQLRKKPDRFGIGEADPDQDDDDWAPPNAFHTYWTLDILSELEQKFPKQYKGISANKVLNLAIRREGMLSWTRQRLGYEISLHSEPKSSVLDTDQLAWSLAIFLRFDRNFHSDLAKQDFVKQALKCLFSTQNDVGTWPHYKPLFHYRDAGNAYCYVFETFAVLLQCALRERAETKVIQALFRPYCKNLMELWRYADSTKIPLPAGDKIFGWSSGHRISKAGKPESWASASVFSYAQALRRLVGIWCREEALKSFIKPQKKLTPKEAEKEIESRGKTWGSNKTPVSERLWTMFINPVRSHDCTDKLGAGQSPIEEDHARSAILFGPPGTSKTSLIRALAAAIEWRYVEIHASHFVAEGLTQVQKTADRIFRQISELDHTVVLFDEIDELVRERDIEKDAFGRFLTTSMLPKLAELWDARKILYFVATNHINYFDSAIVRSHRFDALILVSPPSFDAKIKELKALLSRKYGLPGRYFETREREIQKELRALRKKEDLVGVDEAQERKERERKLDSQFMLAKFALLRYDELDELASRLASVLKSESAIPRKITSLLLAKALRKVGDSEWRKNKSYFDFLRDTRSERRDYQMVGVRGRVEIKRLPSEQ